MNRRDFLTLAAKTVGVVAVASLVPSLHKLAGGTQPPMGDAEVFVDGGNIFDLEFNNMTITFANGCLISDCIFKNCKILLVGAEDAGVAFFDNHMYGSHVTVGDHASAINVVFHSAPAKTSFVGVRVLGEYDEFTLYMGLHESAARLHKLAG